MRCAIYARFSTDLQNQKSVEDQIYECSEYIQRQGATFVGAYNDQGISGASIHNRPGLKSLLQAARNREFDAIIVEDFNRFSRNAGDLLTQYDVLTFHGVKLISVHQGEADPMTLGLHGIVGQMQRQSGVAHIKRGMRGNVRKGRHAGGRAYGYRAAPVVTEAADGTKNVERGFLEIVPEDAEIVRRIFAEYAAGKTARDIAGDLNGEGVRPPRGAVWNASTIYGQEDRGSGILRNELYVGRIVWDKVKMVRNPETGKRVSRPNARDKRETYNVPELAIIEQETWDKVQAILKAKSKVHPSSTRKIKRPFSGLLRCGACGGGLSIYDSYQGRKRVRCSRAKESGTCSDSHTYYLDWIEDEVIVLVRHNLKHPDAIKAFIKDYLEGRRAARENASSRRFKLERRHGELVRSINRLTDLMVEGRGDERTLSDKIKAQAAERNQIEADVEALKQEQQEGVVDLHPTALRRYEEAIDNLADALARGSAAGDHTATGIIRELFERIIVHPATEKEAAYVEIQGRLAALIRLPEEKDPLFGRVSGGLEVAEEGLEPPTRGL